MSKDEYEMFLKPENDNFPVGQSAESRHAAKLALHAQDIGAPGADPSSPLRRHTWLLTVLGDLHRYAQREGLTEFAQVVHDAGERLLDEIRCLADGDREGGKITDDCGNGTDD